MRAIALGDAGYPDGLRVLSDAPRFVYVAGAPIAPPQRCVAIVGSRAASAYGLACAAQLARDLAALGFTIVSGFARGIDAAAHRGALDAGGRTLAVLPSGLDRLTPPQHAALAREIVREGALLSEVASGPPFGRGAFVKRNRLIAALSAATIVAEASPTSGALSTAAAAARAGRPVFAVPGDIDRPTSRGTLDLLRAGARVCADAGDVLAVLGSASGDARSPRTRVHAALDATARTLEDLSRRAGLSPAEVLAELLPLTWAGVAAGEPGQRWRRGAAGVRV